MVAKLLTYGGQVIDPTAYIYICCEVIIWSKFGLLRGHYLVQDGVIIWSKVGSLSGPRLFPHYKNRGFRRFAFAQLSFCVFFCAQSSGRFLKIAFSKKGGKIGFFNFLCFKFKIL